MLKKAFNLVFGEVPPKKKKAKPAETVQPSAESLQTEQVQQAAEQELKKEAIKEKLPVHPPVNDSRLSFERITPRRERRLTENLENVDKGERMQRESEYPVYEFDNLEGKDRKAYIDRMVERFNSVKDWKGLVGEERYDLLWLIAKYGDKSAAKKILEILQVPKAAKDGSQEAPSMNEVRKKINDLIKAGRVKNAIYLAELVDYAEEDENFSMRKNTEASIVVNGKLPAPTEFGKYYNEEKRTIMHELPLLYAYSLALATIEGVRQQQKNGIITLESEQLLLLARMEERVRNFVNDLYKFVRSYLVLAVLSEVQFAWRSNRGDGETPRVMGFTYSSSYLRQDIVEELIPDTEAAMSMLAAARFVFTTPGAYSSGYGGKPWAQIADLAYDMFAAPDKTPLAEKIHLLDRAAQLEHNGGSVFDKDSYRVSQGYGLQALLDLKRNTPHLTTDILQNFLTQHEVEPLKRLNNLQNDLNRLKEVLRVRNAQPIPSLDGMQEAA
ncbi:MAG TPA: hypothetical protein VEB18_00975 [Candidatus Paceibacterota bacterium]|nr:hypothetical protein [Candidatus Paceibacterota bacterium]